MPVAVNREASRNITRKASKMVEKANITQRDASAAFDSGDDFSHQSTQAMDNYDNFDQTIMGLEVSQTEDPLSLESSSPAWSALRSVQRGDLYSMFHSLIL